MPYNADFNGKDQAGAGLYQVTNRYGRHGTAELAFTGGAAALLLGIGVGFGAVGGAVVAGLVFGLLGLRQRERDSVIGVVLAFGLGVGVLLLALHEGRASNKFGLLTGSIVSVDTTNLWLLGLVTVLVLGTLAVVYRPLLFASTDPDVALVFALTIALILIVATVAAAALVALAVTSVRTYRLVRQRATSNEQRVRGNQRQGSA